MEIAMKIGVIILAIIVFGIIAIAYKCELDDRKDKLIAINSGLKQNILAEVKLENGNINLFVTGLFDNYFEAETIAASGAEKKLYTLSYYQFIQII